MCKKDQKDSKSLPTCSHHDAQQQACSTGAPMLNSPVKGRIFFTCWKGSDFWTKAHPTGQLEESWAVPKHSQTIDINTSSQNWFIHSKESPTTYHLKISHYPQIQGDVYPKAHFRKAPKPPTQWHLRRIFELQPKPWLHRSSVTTVSDVTGWNWMKQMHPKRT